MPNINPEFYSLLAQCASAIIGILSAIIASKLNSQSHDAIKSQFELERALKKSRNLVKTRIHDLMSKSEDSPNKEKVLAQLEKIQMHKYSDFWQIQAIFIMYNYTSSLDDVRNIINKIKEEMNIEQIKMKHTLATSIILPVIMTVVILWFTLACIITPMVYFSMPLVSNIPLLFIFFFSVGIMAIVGYIVFETVHLHRLRKILN